MSKKCGRQTVRIDNVKIKSAAAIVGEKDGSGPIAQYFDIVLPDNEWNEKTWEKTESKMQREAIRLAVQKSKLSLDDMDRVFSGDLLNQCIGAGFGLRGLEIPFYGIYGACSTMIEGISLASMLIDGGFAEHAAAATSSHFCTAERQYRTPLEYGGQRTPNSQWTVTGAGCSVVTSEKSPVRIAGGTVGKIVDMGIKDANKMGAAMAPAAADTVTAFLRDTQTEPDDYDLILTGDLGKLGKELFIMLMKDEGYDVGNVYNDCGCMIFYPEQTAPMGASGCGCAATVLNGAVLSSMLSGKTKNVILAATGAMLSPVSSCQGENIPGISYAINFRREV